MSLSAYPFSQGHPLRATEISVFAKHARQFLRCHETAESAKCNILAEPLIQISINISTLGIVN